MTADRKPAFLTQTQTRDQVNTAMAYSLMRHKDTGGRLFEDAIWAAIKSQTTNSHLFVTMDRDVVESEASIEILEAEAWKHTERELIFAVPPMDHQQKARSPDDLAVAISDGQVEISRESDGLSVQTSLDKVGLLFQPYIPFLTEEDITQDGLQRTMKFALREWRADPHNIYLAERARELLEAADKLELATELYIDKAYLGPLTLEPEIAAEIGESTDDGLRITILPSSKRDTTTGLSLRLFPNQTVLEIIRAGDEALGAFYSIEINEIRFTSQED